MIPSPLPSAAKAPLVSIVVVTYNAPKFVRLALESIQARTRLPYELIVVDNASGPETRQYLREAAGIRLIQNGENRLWAAGCNQGMRAADPRSAHVLLLNSDVEVLRDDWLDVLLRVMESDPRVAMVGPRHNRVEFGPIYGYIDGHCLLIRREMLEQVGYFDAERWPWFGAPGEMTVAAYAKGWIYKVIHPKDRLVLHYGGKSQTEEFKRIKQALPRARTQFREIMQRYGIAPTAGLLDRGGLPRPLRAWAERRRFYYAPPAGRVGNSR